MYYNEYRHSAERSYSSLYVFGAVFVFICCVILGSLRLYGLNLERRISETSGKIEFYREKNVALSNEYSKVLSPARIYNYAKQELGMVNADAGSVVYLDNNVVLSAKNRNIENEVKEEGLVARFNLFVNRAHAKD